MNPPLNEMELAHLRELTRRTLFKEVGYGLGSVALTSMLAGSAGAVQTAQTASKNPFAVRPSHFAPRAKRVIYLFMAGAPSQIDLFDPKPALVKHNGEPIPEEFTKGQRFAFIKGTPRLLGSPHQFEQVGQSGQWISSLLPHLKTVADDLTVIRSMHTEQFNHAPAQLFMNTGFQLPDRPSMGSWLTYGLGTENQDLPGFVVLLSGISNPDGGNSCWGSGFLPPVFQGTKFRSQGEPVLFVENPPGVDRPSRRQALDALGDLNRMALQRAFDPETEARIASYELAYRMQSSVPDLMDIKGEKPETMEAYGAKPGEASFANNCLLARRMAERGVRFIQLYHRGWDHHGDSEGNDIKHGLPDMCRQIDQPIAALLKDLKQRGLLEDTLVVWGGEFGRTPMNEARGGVPFPGRDHHPNAFTMWMAGGGTRPGSYGQTDELGYSVAKDPVGVHDLHATMLHLLGLDHTRLTYRHLGRDFRLTDVSGNVIKPLIA
jgi:hypothetical protein